jgi:hypothetical protein
MFVCVRRRKKGTFAKISTQRHGGRTSVVLPVISPFVESGWTADSDIACGNADDFGAHDLRGGDWAVPAFFAGCAGGASSGTNAGADSGIDGSGGVRGPQLPRYAVELAGAPLPAAEKRKPVGSKTKYATVPLPADPVQPLLIPIR